MISRRRVSVACALLVVALAHPPLVAWRGDGNARGRVRDADGQPLPEARVVLRLDADPSSGPPEVRTNENGRWSIAGLAGGLWRIVIEAEGHVTSYGRLMIPGRGMARPVEVRLRSLEIVTPGSSENNPDTIRSWLEMGASLLREGMYPEARREYDKALDALPVERHPEILRELAHAWYLEGDRRQAYDTLCAAMRIDPGDTISRRLLLEICPELELCAEAEAFLAGLEVDSGESIAGSIVEIPAEEPPPPPSYPVRPLLPPEPHRTGRFRTSFPERIATSDLAEYVSRSGYDLQAILERYPEAGDVELTEEDFELYVPESYDETKTYGLFVWISPSPFGGAERAETLAAFDEGRLISIGANESGNERPRWERAALALEAAAWAQRLYRIDPRRVYVAGYSGGGRVASQLAMLYPEVFDGGLFIKGCDHYRELPIPDRPGAGWPASFAKPDKATLRVVKRESRLVLLTGERDFNQVQTEVTYEDLLDQGFRQVTYLEIPEATHYDPVGKEWWLKAFGALDGELHPTALATPDE